MLSRYHSLQSGIWVCAQRYDGCPSPVASCGCAVCTVRHGRLFTPCYFACTMIPIMVSFVTCMKNDLVRVVLFPTSTQRTRSFFVLLSYATVHLSADRSQSITGPRKGRQISESRILGTEPAGPFNSRFGLASTVQQA